MLSRVDAPDSLLSNQVLQLMHILYQNNTDCLWSPTILDDSKAPEKTSYDLTDPFNFERSLALGEPWEDFLVDYLTASGLRAYRIHLGSWEKSIIREKCLIQAA